jgi:hypothetical protein
MPFSSCSPQVVRVFVGVGMILGLYGYSTFVGLAETLSSLATRATPSCRQGACEPTAKQLCNGKRLGGVARTTDRGTPMELCLHNRPRSEAVR